MSTAYLLERAWVDGAVRDDVLVEIEDGRFTRVEPAGRVVDSLGEISASESPLPRLSGEMTPTRLPGLTLPGFANTHSHAFHRALRGRTQRERGTFWTWREQMYAAAAALDPDSYHRLARAVFREMVAAGMTAVGEFHYLHHQPDGTPYDDPHAMTHAVVAAAAEAGIRLTLLDTCYLSSGFGEPVAGVQRRFSDGDVDGWLARVSGFTGPDDGFVAGAAIHSVRAVPAEAMPAIVDHAAGRPLHAHVSEQVAENQACVATYARTPVELLADHDVLGPLTTAVHATHLTDDDVALLARSGTWAGFCPTTERDLGDGIGPGRRLHDAGVRLTLGSDSHAVVDPFEEMRALELDERLATQQRGHWAAGELLDVATGHGHASLGWPDAGALAPGRRADLVTLDTTSPRTAGTGRDAHTAVFAATAADVTHVVVDGRVVVREGDREEIGRDLDAAVTDLWKEIP